MRGVTQARGAAVVFAGVVGAAIVALWLVASFMHMGDRLGLNHVSGAWIALGELARDGNFYPPLVGENTTGGTRFMAIPILTQALLSAVLPSPIIAGKLANLLATGALCAGILGCARRLGNCAGVGVFLASVVLLTEPGWLSGTTIRYDAIAVALQVWALFLVFGGAGNLTDRAACLIGVLCALAFLSKRSAGWGGVGIGLTLLVVERRAGLIVILSGMLTAIIGLALVHLLSEGRFWENVLGLSFAGGGGGDEGGDSLLWSFARSAKRLVIEFSLTSTASLALAPWFLVVMARCLRRSQEHHERRRVLCFSVFLVLSGFVTLVANREIGVASNHLLDLVVLAPIAAAIGRPRAFGRWVLIPALVGAAIWAIPLKGGRHISLAFSNTELRASGELGPTPLSGRFDEGSRLLSEDPLVPVMLGTDVVMLDAFMILRIENIEPGTRSAMADRVRAREFDGIVLLRPVHKPFNPEWFDTMHFGREIAGAIEGSYEFIGMEDGYAVYLPGDRSGERGDQQPDQNGED